MITRDDLIALGFRSVSKEKYCERFASPEEYIKADLYNYGKCYTQVPLLVSYSNAIATRNALYSSILCDYNRLKMFHQRQIAKHQEEITNLNIELEKITLNDE